MNRRGFLTGMAGILASGFAPAVVGSGVLMPIKRPIWIGTDPALVAYTDVFTLTQLRNAVNTCKRKAVQPEWIGGLEYYVLRQGELDGLWRL